MISCVIEFLDHWQTLATGALAIVAAVIGAHYVNKQTLESHRQERERMARRHMAIRAALPLSLSYLFEYERECASSLKQLYDQRKGEKFPDNVQMQRLPDMPSGIVDDLKLLIESDDGSILAAAIALISNLQVQAGRLRGLSNQVERSNHDELLLAANVEDFIVDAAEVYARLVQFLKYARFEVATVTAAITTTQLDSALTNLLFLDAPPRLLECIRRRVEYRATKPILQSQY